MALAIKAIEFTALAQQQLHTITDHILKEFGSKSAQKFLIAVEQKLQQIAERKIVLTCARIWTV